MKASTATADTPLRQACTRDLQRAGGRARRLVGQRPVSRTPPSLSHLHASVPLGVSTVSSRTFMN